MAKTKIYPFAVASIRAMENSLLTKQKMLQMADAKNMEEAMRVLGDSAYGSNQSKDMHDFEGLISAHLEDTYQRVAGLVPSDPFIDIFLYKNDYHNIKVLLKEEVTKTDNKRLLSPSGTIPLEDLKKHIRERNYVELPNIDGQYIEDATAMFAKTRDGKYIDTILDRAYFSTITKAAEISGHKFLKDYIKLEIDINNLKIAYRLRQSRRSAVILEDSVLEGGNVSAESVMKAFRTDSLAVGFKETPYADFCEANIEKGFTEFEKACDDYLMSYIKDAKYKTMTLEPVMAFILAKETEAKCVRIILTCKAHDVEPEIIKERVRETYV